jgi:hypothetical protein
MSTTIPSLGQNSAFGPDATQAMGAAFDKACQMLHGGGQPDIAKEVIARRIIELARDGERNPDRLCERVLAAMDIKAATDIKID